MAAFSFSSFQTYFFSRKNLSYPIKFVRTPVDGAVTKSLHKSRIFVLCHCWQLCPTCILPDAFLCAPPVEVVWPGQHCKLLFLTYRNPLTKFNFLSKKKYTSDISQNFPVLSLIYVDMNYVSALSIPFLVEEKWELSMGESIFSYIKSWSIFNLPVGSLFPLVCRWMFSWQYSLWFSFINILPPPILIFIRMSLVVS